jgi:hypothetical protein
MDEQRKGPDKNDPLGTSDPSGSADGAIRSTASSPPAYILTKMRLTSILASNIYVPPMHVGSVQRWFAFEA